MRISIGVAVVALLGAAAAEAAPNVFWTFGFDLPRHGERAPHFGAVAKDAQYAEAAPQAMTPNAAAPLVVAASLTAPKARPSPIGAGSGAGD